jgi:NAD(P)-dependent dehydrogenase (short-subunit alcohol dehydrogenase family)
MHAALSFADQNIAGAQFDQLVKQGKLSERDAWNQSWNVNTTGTQVMTSTFIPLLLQASDPRLLFITSATSTLAGSENQDLVVNKYPPKGWPKTGFGVPAYRSAKTGMNMLMREWHKTLHEDGVKVFALSPGFLATGLGGNPEMTKKMGAGNPEIAGPFIRSVIEGERDSDAGKVINKDGIQPW